MLKISEILLLILSIIYFVSCGLLETKDEGELIIKLDPQTAKIDDEITLIIKNETNISYWYHCGYTVERFIDNNWKPHTTFGCAGEFPIEIKSGDHLSEDIFLAADEPGIYRIIVILRKEDETIEEAKRASREIELILDE
jgi:hypothetical protein